MKAIINSVIAFFSFIPAMFRVPANPVSVECTSHPVDRDQPQRLELPVRPQEEPGWVSRTKVRVPTRAGSLMSFKVIRQEGDVFTLRQPNGRKAFVRHLPALAAA